MITQRTHANLPPADMLWCSATEGCCILSRDEVARARRGIRAIEEDRACLRANMLCGGAHRPLKRQGVLAAVPVIEVGMAHDDRVDAFEDLGDRHRQPDPRVRSEER